MNDMYTENKNRLLKKNTSSGYEAPNVTSVADIERLIKEHHLFPDSESESRRLLVDGFNCIKARLEYARQLNERFGFGLNVDHMNSWIHDLVKNKLGGRIRDDKIEWDISGKKVVMDPISCSIEGE